MLHYCKICKSRIITFICCFEFWFKQFQIIQAWFSQFYLNPFLDMQLALVRSGIILVWFRLIASLYIVLAWFSLVQFSLVQFWFSLYFCSAFRFCSTLALLKFWFKPALALVQDWLRPDLGLLQSWLIMVQTWLTHF